MQESESIHLRKYKNTLLHWSDFLPYATSNTFYFQSRGFIFNYRRQNEKIQVLILQAALCRQTSVCMCLLLELQSKSLTESVKPALTYSQPGMPGTWPSQKTPQWIHLGLDLQQNKTSPCKKAAPPHSPKERDFLLLPFLHTPHIQTDIRIHHWSNSLLYITECFHPL